MYISLANSFNHCTQGSTRDGSNTPPSLGRCSVVNNVDVSSVSMASSELRDSRGEAVLVLEVPHEVGELSALHVVLTSIEFVLDRCKGIRDLVELRGEVGLLLVKSMVLIHLSGGGRVVEATDLLDEHVITPISGGEEGKELGRRGLRGVLSIVRTEEEFDDVGGFPWLSPGQ